MAMLHPTYNDIMEVVNKNTHDGEEPVIKSRYSVVIAAAKRARQIIDGAPELLMEPEEKPLTVAIDELYRGKVSILGEGEEEEEAADTEAAAEPLNENE